MYKVTIPLQFWDKQVTQRYATWYIVTSKSQNVTDPNELQAFPNFTVSRVTTVTSVTDRVASFEYIFKVI